MSSAGEKMPPYRTVRARAEIAYWDVGEGRPVLLLHTFPDHALGMLPLARDLAAAGHRVIVPSLPGYQPSGAVPDDDYTIQAVAGDILRLAEAVGLEDRPHVVGHGWGGEIAYHLGAHAADRVDRVVVLSVPHAAGLPARHRSFEGLQSAGYAYFLAYGRHAPEIASRPEWLTAAVAWASPGMHREDWPAILSHIAKPSQVATACRYYRCDLESESEPAVIQAPTAVIHGADTPALPPGLYEGLERWFAVGLTRHLVHDAGQWPHLEAPRHVLELILAHLHDD